jgi:glycine/D-amino acid oxidase-like deaminating enzyme
LRVVGLDAGRVAAGAAGRNGGFLLGGPALFLHDSIAAWGQDAALTIYRATLAELDHLANVLGPQIVRRTGSIRLAGLPGAAMSDAEAEEREHELADVACHETALRTHAIAVEGYHGSLGEGIFLPDDATTNPALRAVALAARLAGTDRVQLYENTRVTRVAPGRVSTERGTVHARVVIVAVDGGLDLLVPQLAGRVRSARLQMLATAPISAGRLPCPVYGRWGYDYAQQTPDGRLFVGGGRDRYVDEEWTTDGTSSAPVQGYLDGLAMRMGGEPVEVTHRWAAPVGFTADGRPLCTRAATGAAGDVIAVGGYNGTGNLVGPVAARAAVALALDGTAPPACFTC